jgi:MarR family transcriptional regulator, organic hydroperoxide resistance regulator
MSDTAIEDGLTLEQQVCFSLAVAARDVVSLYRPLLEPLGLTHPQYLVMVTLWQQTEPVSVKDLSALLKLEPPTLSPLLKRLQAAGFIQRQRDSSDERSVKILLTQRGRDLRRRATQIPSAVVKRLDMTVEELETLQQILLRVIERANVRGRSGPTGGLRAR